MKIIECVPNFSEGRDDKKILSIVSVFKMFPGVRLADFSGDADHNRSVFTFWENPMMCWTRHWPPVERPWN